jgi:hypothetical protein
MSRKKNHLEQIISSCELILDDINNGANIEQADFNMLGYVDSIMLRMQEKLNKQLTPTNIRGGFYPANGKPTLMDE